MYLTARIWKTHCSVGYVHRRFCIREMIPLGNGACSMDALSTILSATNIYSWRGTLLVPNTKSVKLSKGCLIWICLCSVVHFIIIICLDLLFSNYSTVFFKYSFNVCYLVSYIYFLFWWYCFAYCFSFLYSYLFPIFIKVYRPLPPNGNQISVNKYHISN